MRFAPYALATAAVLAIGACATGVSTVGQQSPMFRTAHNNYALNGRDVSSSSRRWFASISRVPPSGARQYAAQPRRHGHPLHLDAPE
jgi:hypothetical protein